MKIIMGGMWIVRHSLLSINFKETNTETDVHGYIFWFAMHDIRMGV